MTEFYKSIPEGIREKLQEYMELQNKELFGVIGKPIEKYSSLKGLIIWEDTPEGYKFWHDHYENKTFPIWSEEQNRFINP